MINKFWIIINNILMIISIGLLFKHNGENEILLTILGVLLLLGYSFFLIPINKYDWNKLE